MALIRTVCFFAAALLLGGGYLASQSAFLAYTTAEFSEKTDVPQIRALSLAILVSCVVFAFIRERQGGDD